MNRGGGDGAIGWLVLLGAGFLAVRACAPVPPQAAGPPDGADEVPVWTRPAHGGRDFDAPPHTRRITLAHGLRLDEAQVEAALRRGGHSGQWAAFTWQVGDEVVATIAPGLDRRHHFASAYLVGFVPFPDVAAWVPLAALAQNKRYRFDHELYGGAMEVWQTSREAFHYPEGDCEDHAIALADWLIGLGHDARVVIGRVEGEGHAWVVLLSGGRTYLLEATHKRPGRVLPLASTLPEYQPEAMFDRERYWVNTGSPLTTDYTGPCWELRSRFARGG